MDAIQFEPMSISGIIDRAFTLYRRNFVRFITLVAVIQVPIALISLLWRAMFDRGVPDPTDAGSLFARAGALFFSAMTTMVGNALCQGALTRSVSDAYMGNETTVEQTFLAVMPKLLPLIGASILTGLIVGLGFMLLVVPGVIFALWLFVTTPSIVVENQGITAAMSRSKALTSGNLGKVFAVSLLVLLITIVVSIPLGIVVGSIPAIVFGGDSMMGKFFIELAGVIAQILAMPIGAAAGVLLYYDLRIRKEGFDLQMLSQSMGAKPE
jgi:hypothetical protein